MNPVVIIGTGLAGYTLAREFRKLDLETPLVLITADAGGFYSKPMLSNALSQGRDAATLLTSDATAMAEKLNADVRTHCRVSGVDTEQKQVQTDSGTIHYSKLVLAVGAQPIRPPMSGDAVAEVISINNLQDYAHFREILKDDSRVVILGPGLIGCEFANDLLAPGRSITVVGPDAYPVSTLVPEAAGRALQNSLAEQGIEWRLGTFATEVSHQADSLLVQLDNGSSLQADLVLSAVGLRPDLRLAEQAGLAVGRGIVADRYLETSASDIFVLGDCAEIDGKNLPFVMPIMHGARALAKTLAGEPSEVCYPVMPVVIKTPACPVVVVPAPPDTDGMWQITGEGTNVQARYVDKADRLLGFTLTGSAVQEKQRLLGLLAS